jgi:hypothetical protein
MPSFELLAIDAPDDLLRGFVAGWAAGCGIAPAELGASIIWGRDRRVDFGRRLQGHPLLVRSDRVEAWVAALATAPLDMRLTARHRIVRASFEFEFSIYSPPEATQVEALFAALPAGVSLEGYESKTRVDPKSAGIELHGAAHDYEFRGHGTASGEVAGILELHERASRHERIRLEDLRLELAA